MTLRRATAIAALLALVTWLPSLRVGFLYDDERLILANRSIRDLGQPATVLRADPTRPVLAVSWGVNYAVAGLVAWPWHLANVLVHVVDTVLVTRLAGAWSRRREDPDPVRAGLLAGAFFAVSPMFAETVGYVASRSTALCASFTLGAILVGLPALESGSRRRLASAWGLFALALATKEEAAALPLLLLLCDLFFIPGGVASRWRLHLPFLLTPVAGLLARRLVTGAFLPPPVHPLGPWLLTQAAAFPLYVLRATLPLDPLFFRGQAVEAAPATWIAAAVGLGLLGWAALRLRQRSVAAFAVLWMAIALAPSSSLVVLKEAVVDHRAYLGTVAVAWMVGRVLAAPGRLPFAVAALVLLMVRTVHYVGVMADPVALWTQATARAPRSPEAQNQLATQYVRDGDPRAEPALQEVVRLAPGDARGWANLGAFYAETGRLPDAVAALRQAAVLAPQEPRVRNNLGLLLAAQGETEAAIAELRAAAAAGPRMAQPRIDLARLLLSRGDDAGARAALDEAARLEIDPQDVRALEALRARLR